MKDMILNRRKCTKCSGVLRLRLAPEYYEDVFVGCSRFPYCDCHRDLSSAEKRKLVQRYGNMDKVRVYLLNEKVCKVVGRQDNTDYVEDMLNKLRHWKEYLELQMKIKTY